MKTAEELQKFCEKWLWKTFQMGLKQSPFDANNSEFYAPLIGLDLSKQMAEEIIKENKSIALEFAAYLDELPYDNWGKKSYEELFTEFKKDNP